MVLLLVYIGHHKLDERYPFCILSLFFLCGIIVGAVLLVLDCDYCLYIDIFLTALPLGCTKCRVNENCSSTQNRWLVCAQLLHRESILWCISFETVLMKCDAWPLLIQIICQPRATLLEIQISGWQQCGQCMSSFQAFSNEIVVKIHLKVLFCATSEHDLSNGLAKKNCCTYLSGLLTYSTFGTCQWVNLCRWNMPCITSPQLCLTASALNPP